MLLAAMAATLAAPLGFALWHYNVAFVLLLAAGAAAWPLLQRRRVATLAMAFSGAPAVVTGFAMLYTRDFPFKEWLTWWHSVTSFALVLAFLVHWLHNRTRLWDLAKRVLPRREQAVGYAYAGAWVGLALAGAWTWLPDVRERFTRENYLHLASWAVLAGVAVAYGAWLLYRLPSMRARLADQGHRNRLRGLVDTSLFAAHWGALLTGFVLLYLDAALRAGTFRYVTKWWHTATSVAFLAFVVLHIGFNARLVAAHARRVDGDLAPRNP